MVEPDMPKPVKLPVSIAAALTIAPDPIFDLIERHRGAYAAAGPAYAAYDAPEYLDVVNDEKLDATIDALHEKMIEAQIELASTEPRTLAGVVAVTRYVIEGMNEDYEVVDDLYGDPRLKMMSWLAVIERAI